MLKLLEKYGIKATWFIPGHSLETFPEECAMIRDAGHEIGLHGYSHENPSDMTLEKQKDVLDKTFKLLTEFCGKPPKGSVAPWWETSQEGVEMLLDYGIEYDHSMSHHDCQCYWFRTGDSWTKIDYSKKAREWMKPLQRGKETGLVEIPGHLARPLRLLLSRIRRVCFSHHVPPRRFWPPPRTDDARKTDRAHQQARGGRVGDHGRGQQGL
ncbi:hypothetical protein KL928_001334 [Ogataea angusta]|uniref:NodB homology domain-containing protein n=1 Tax=Pichia angusta TaxID=870730 RepID=A0AAN6I8N1_PICAN|nr:uncharacterized protein KL928_001334 [Ogataea angusta]KAG7821250.1 hypothetical protein KL928_001334 [Ogataea angusta]